MNQAIKGAIIGALIGMMIEHPELLSRLSIKKNKNSKEKKGVKNANHSEKTQNK